MSSPENPREDEMFGDGSESEDRRKRARTDPDGDGGEQDEHEEDEVESSAGQEVEAQEVEAQEVDADGDDDDLFGDDEVGEKKSKVIDDNDPDVLSDLDDAMFGELEDGKKDRGRGSNEEDADGEDADEEAGREVKSQGEVSLGRYAVPDPSDGDLYILRIPTHIPLIPYYFEPEKFEAPKSSLGGPTPYTLATNSIRFRRHPTDNSKLQSNSRIIRWSDGSLSLQIGSSPELYDLPRKPLAPGKDEVYDDNKDSHTFLATPHEGAGMLRVVGHITKGLSVIPADDKTSDEAMVRLNSQWAAAIAAKGGRAKNMEINSLEDPERLRREAEKAEKERLRAQKKLENQRRRQLDAGMGIVDRDRHPRKSEGGISRKRHSPGGGVRRGATREDDYDKEDGFLDDEDEDDEGFIVDDEDEDEEMDGWRKNKKKKEKAAKKSKKEDVVESEEEEEEAEFTEEESDSEEERRRRKKEKKEREREREKDKSKGSASAVAEVEDEGQDEDDFATGGPARKRRRAVVEEDEEE